MTEDIEQLVQIIQNWATTIPCNIKVYLFGSRINGTPRIDSDLDIGMELIDINNPEERMRIWFRLHDYWHKQLIRILPYAPHLCLYEKPNTIEDADFLTTKKYYLIFDNGKNLIEQVT